MMDIQSQSTVYLQRIAHAKQKHRFLYEVEVYVLLLCITALTVFVILREYLSYAMVVLIPCLLSSIYYYHSLHTSSAVDLQMSMSRGRKDSNSGSSSISLDHTVTSSSPRALSSPALYDLTSLGNRLNSSITKTNTAAIAFNSFKYNENFNLTSPQQLVRRIMLSPSSSSSPAFDSSPSKASNNYSSSRQPFYSPLSHSTGSPLEHAVPVPQWHTYHSSPPVQQHLDFKSRPSPLSAGRMHTTNSDPLDGRDNDPSLLLNDVIKRIAARQGVTRVESGSTILSPSSVDQHQQAAVESHSFEAQQMEELQKMLVMLSTEIVQTLSLRVADSGMRISFLQSSADQKRLQAVLELKTDRLDLGLNGRIGWIEVVNQCQLLGVSKDVMGRYEWVATRVRYYRQRTEADKEGESVEGRDQWSSDRRSVRSGR